MSPNCVVSIDQSCHNRAVPCGLYAHTCMGRSLSHTQTTPTHSTYLLISYSAGPSPPPPPTLTTAGAGGCTCGGSSGRCCPVDA